MRLLVIPKQGAQWAFLFGSEAGMGDGREGVPQGPGVRALSP